MNDNKEIYQATLNKLGLKEDQIFKFPMLPDIYKINLTDGFLAISRKEYDKWCPNYLLPWLCIKRTAKDVILIEDEWVRVPSFPKYRINKKGEIIGYLSSVLKATKQKNKPDYVMLTSTLGIQKSVKVCDLVAETFLDKQEDKLKCFIKFKDGNIHNHGLNNLEYVRFRDSYQAKLTVKMQRALAELKKVFLPEDRLLITGEEVLIGVDYFDESYININTRYKDVFKNFMNLIINTKDLYCIRIRLGDSEFI